MIKINLNYGGEVNFWFKPANNLKIIGNNVLNKEYNIASGDLPIRNTVIAEIFLPRGGRNIYGLLGLEYKAGELNTLKVMVPTNKNTYRKIFDEALISKTEPAYIGLFDNYEEYIFNCISRLISDNQIKIIGELNFCYSACAEVSSNGWVFNKLTELLLYSLYRPIEEINREAIEHLINQM